MADIGSSRQQRSNFDSSQTTTPVKRRPAHLGGGKTGPEPCVVPSSPRPIRESPSRTRPAPRSTLQADPSHQRGFINRAAGDRSHIPHTRTSHARARGSHGTASSRGSMVADRGARPSGRSGVEFETRGGSSPNSIGPCGPERWRQIAVEAPRSNENSDRTPKQGPDRAMAGPSAQIPHRTAGTPDRPLNTSDVGRDGIAGKSSPLNPNRPRQFRFQHVEKPSLERSSLPLAVRRDPRIRPPCLLGVTGT
jgi:hypothetical protein